VRYDVLDDLLGGSPHFYAGAIKRRLQRMTFERIESRTATAMTPSRWRTRRQLGRRAEAGPHQLQPQRGCPSAPERIADAAME
jgi:hypothetical protein